MISAWGRGGTLLTKVIALTLFIWLFNVLFVAVHEFGHASLAIAFGAKIYGFHISPSGYDGATAYTTLSNATRGSLVLAGGLLATAAATWLVYRLKIELAVYVVGIRTVESLTNFTRGSDMAAVAGWAGGLAYLAAFLLAGVILACLWQTVYEKRLSSIRPSGERPPVG